MEAFWVEGEVTDGMGEIELDYTGRLLHRKFSIVEELLTGEQPGAAQSQKFPYLIAARGVPAAALEKNLCPSISKPCALISSQAQYL